MSIKTTKDDLVPRMLRDFADDIRTEAEELPDQELELGIGRIAGLLDRIAAAVAVGDHDTADAMAEEIDIVFQELRNRKLRN